MIEFGGSIYYIDIKAFDKAVLSEINGKNLADTETKITYGPDGRIISTETYEKRSPRKEIDISKYDLLKTFIEYIIDYNDVSDDALGVDRALQETPLGYKMVFNTLLKEGIIKEK